MFGGYSLLLCLPFFSSEPLVRRRTTYDPLSTIMFCKPLQASLARRRLRTLFRPLHATSYVRESPTKFTNILAGANVPKTQVKTVTLEGFHLEDGRIVPGPCIFLEGKVFLWNVPPTLWDGWKPEHFEVFDVAVPKPGALGCLV